MARIFSSSVNMFYLLRVQEIVRSPHPLLSYITGADTGPTLETDQHGGSSATEYVRGVTMIHESEAILSRLKVEHLGYHVESLLEQAAKKEVNNREFLCIALLQEWDGKH